MTRLVMWILITTAIAVSAASLLLLTATIAALI